MLLVLALLFVRPAHGQERTNAEELFQLGKAAMTRQDYPKACGYFQASLDADFALGTLLNLAICHEQVGKLAAAWAEFRTLEDRARRAKPPQVDRADFAHDHVEALRPRLSRVRIVLSPEASATKGLSVKVDGVIVAPELFDAGVPVDPGKRSLSARAPGHEEWSQVLAVDDEGLKLVATVPPLRPTPVSAPSPPAPAVDLVTVEQLSAQRSQRAIGLVVGGVGVASLTTGAVFGVLAIVAANNARCPEPCFKLQPPSAGGGDNPKLLDAQDAYRRTNVFGWVSNITIGAGLVGIAIGAYLVLTARPTSAKSTASPRVQYLTLPHGAGLALGAGY